MNATNSGVKTLPTDASTGEQARRIIEQMDVSPCHVCQDLNADEESLLMEHGGGGATWYACCPKCWYRIERFGSDQ